MNGSRVAITEIRTGVTRSFRTDPEGRFYAPLLPPGDYRVFAEQLGYRPLRLGGVPVTPGRTQRLNLTLRPVELPVSEVRVDRYRPSAMGTRAGSSQWFSELALDLPEERRDLITLSRLSTISDDDLGAEGLPGRLSGLAVNGVASETAIHTDLMPGRRRAAAHRLGGFRAAELLTNAVDVEWSGFASATLNGLTRRGSAQPEVRFLGDWTGSPVTVSDLFDDPANATHSLRGGLVASGPIVRDTAHFSVGVEVERLELPMPRAWEPTALDADLTAVARDSFGVSLEPYTRTLEGRSLVVAAYGAFDYQVTQNHAINVHGRFADLESALEGGFKPLLGPGHLASLGAGIDGRDFGGGGSLTSIFGPLISNEFRLGVDFSEREYLATSPPATRVIDGGLGFGSDPVFPGVFETTALRLRDAIHVHFPRHRLKIGGGAALLFYDQRYSFGRAGQFTFAGPTELARLEGAFSQTTGGTPLARFLTQMYSAFVQDRWNAAPGLEVTFGLRYDWERLDGEEVRTNSDLLATAGLDNAAFDQDHHKLSPRFGLVWDVSDRGEWVLRAGAGIYHGMVDPGLFGELITHDGRVVFRRGVGSFGSYLSEPDLAAAPVLGPRFTLLGPEFGPPRSGRASLGLTRLFASGALHIFGAYRHTDFLPRRHDLNLPLAPAGADQHGRPIFGELTRQGSLITVVPGTNRRLPDFDLISAMDADGFSTFWSAGVALERRVDAGLNLLAAYTFSRTTDNWLSGSGPEAQLTPFPDSLAGEDWADSYSDFDVPHRAVLGAEWVSPYLGRGIRVAVLYRFRSGLPFTAGFREGVDVNGDGSGLNDPAFIDSSVDGIEPLIAEWDCLADRVGAFAERNSCRGRDAHVLDARIRIGLASFQGNRLELVIDALNLFDSDTEVPDRALYLIDRAAPLVTAPDGSVTLPLISNPNFGKTRVRHSTGRVFRFGLRMGF